MNSTFRQVMQRLQTAERIVALTGAGVSAESGVPTFRGPDGLWRSHRPEELATPQAFRRDPALVWEWYDWRRQRIAACHPNRAHYVLAAWSDRFPVFDLVTQNVDGLHRKAGSRQIHHLHGDIWTVRCAECGQETVDERVPLPQLPPRCPCGGLIRPGVVWFGEALPETVLESAIQACQAADVAIVAGTSGLVHPAAGLPALARQSGAWVVECNIERTPLTPLAHAFLEGPAGQVLDHLDKELNR